MQGVGYINGWRILHGGDNEREGQLNGGGGCRDWVAKLKGYMEPELYYRGELGTS